MDNVPGLVCDMVICFNRAHSGSTRVAPRSSGPSPQRTDRLTLFHKLHVTCKSNLAAVGLWHDSHPIRVPTRMRSNHGPHQTQETAGPKPRRSPEGAYDRERPIYICVSNSPCRLLSSRNADGVSGRCLWKETRLSGKGGEPATPGREQCAARVALYYLQVAEDVAADKRRARASPRGHRDKTLDCTSSWT